MPHHAPDRAANDAVEAVCGKYGDYGLRYARLVAQACHAATGTGSMPAGLPDSLAAEEQVTNAVTDACLAAVYKQARAAA